MKVRVRMYRQGLGDCFLISCSEADAPPDAPFVHHVLIDCGTLGATSTGVSMDAVVQNIRDATEGHLDLLIATHEHKDHVSGFLIEQAVVDESSHLTKRPAFDDFQVDHVWLAWTEDAGDDLAKSLQRHKGDLITAAKLAAVALEGNDLPSRDDRAATAEIGAGIRRLMAFEDEDLLGADLAKTVQAAMAYVTRRTSPAPPEFLRPGNAPIEPDWLKGLRFYVLGPPRDAKMLANLGEHGSPELYGLSEGRGESFAASARFAAAKKSFDAYCAGLSNAERRVLFAGMPFDQRYRVDVGDAASRPPFTAAYYAANDDWRRIDFAWLTGAADLALQMDGQTNNTSLALAIEIVASGRVLLFPADAQLGNWLSWHMAVDDYGDLVRDDGGNPKRDDAGNPLPRMWSVKGEDGTVRTFPTADLLRRTVFYKVGHHASHNATLQAQGLELMPGGPLSGDDLYDAGDPAPGPGNLSSDGPSPRGDLVAMIPVDRAVALGKTPPWLMPARPLYRRLIEKANGRVVRSDIGWAARRDADFKNLFEKAEWDAFEAAQKAAADAGRVVVSEMFVDCVFE